MSDAAKLNAVREDLVGRLVGMEHKLVELARQAPRNMKDRDLAQVEHLCVLLALKEVAERQSAQRVAERNR